ncbi:MAG TPA: MFS transporter [Ktedonobacterales bacterium]
MTAPSGPLTESAAPAPRAPAPRRGSMFAPLGYRDYRLLFAGQLISFLGDAFYAVALPWYMLTQGGGPVNLGLVLTAYGVPMGAATLLGGWLSDKLRPRRVMLFSDFIRMFILLGLAWVTFGFAGAVFGWHGAPLGVIAALAATLGLFDGMFMPASQAVTPDLIPDDQLQAANGLYYSLARLAQMIGPALAGAVVSRAGSPASFAIDGATFAVSTLTLVFIRGRALKPSAAPTTPADDTSPFEAASATATDSLWRFTFSAPYFMLLLVIMIVANLFNGATEVALPALANGPLGSNAQGFGFMLAAAGAGGLAGGLLASAVGGRVNRGWMSLLFFAFQVAPITVMALIANIYVAITCMAAFGALNGLGNVTFLTLVQRKLPRNLLGRIMGVFAFCNFATFPVSAAVAGFAVQRYGPQTVILAGAVILGAPLIAAFLNRDLREL